MTYLRSIETLCETSSLAFIEPSANGTGSTIALIMSGHTD